MAKRGEKVSEQTRERMSIAQKGKTLSEEHKRKVGLSSRGRRHTEEFKKSVSALFRKEVSWEVRENGCHECTSHKKAKDGYAKIFVDGKQTSVHRHTYEKTNGKVPKGLVVRHTCDNRICMNPKHLVVGTPADNVNDARIRKRLRTMERVPSSKLTREQVVDILKSNSPSRVLAKQYGVCKTNIRNIQKRIWWKDVVV